MAIYGSPNISDDYLKFVFDSSNLKSYSGTGTTWYDISGNYRVSTLTGSYVYDSSNYPNSLFFGGNDSYSSLAMQSILDISLSLSSDKTIDCWIKPYNDSNPRVLSMFNESGNLQVGYLITTLRPYIRIANASYSSNTSLISGSWVNVVYQNYNSSYKIFINGEETTLYSGGPTGNAQFSAIGSGITGFGMNGNIAYVSYHSTALTADQIKTNFNSLRYKFGVI